MADLQTKERELTPAELATYGIEPKQPDGPKLVKVQDQQTLDRAVAVSEPMPLFSGSEIGDFRSQWSTVQTGFVDKPRRTVEDADKLVAAVMDSQKVSPTSDRAWKNSGIAATTCPLKT
jgi:hypothetical protein